MEGQEFPYREGFSHATGLPDACADIVTCSQALHWMEPMGTFREAARILRPGGVFAAYDYDWPPVTTSPETDALYLECMAKSRRLRSNSAYPKVFAIGQRRTPGASARGAARLLYVRECTLHHIDKGNATRLVGLLLSQGHVQTLLKHGVSRGRSESHRSAKWRRNLEDDLRDWYWSSRVRIGVK